MTTFTVRTPRALRFRGRRDVSCLVTDTFRTMIRHPRVLTLSNEGGYLNVARQVTALARFRGHHARLHDRGPVGETQPRPGRHNPGP